MSEQQNAETLRALSDIDVSILRIKKQLDELPHKQQILEVRQKSKELELKALQVQQMANEVARTLVLLSDETQHSDEQIAHAQSVLDKTNEYRETSNLVAEIEMLATRKAQLEEDSLIQMEKQEKIAGVGAQVAEAARKLEAEEQAYTDAYRDAGGRLKQEIFDLQHAREALVATLPENLARDYLSAVEKKTGIGAAHLIDNRCSGCFCTLSEGQLAKLFEGPLIGICPNCNRILVTVATQEAG
ncbi:MAG: hypothetical protein LBP91_05285 [Coriobacteriales bacterium]|jgi:predicted  nucleic acid-binding Zn-ribbon protein|nr:hypothetical protein [Coriobacteriales bacterium]